MRCLGGKVRLGGRIVAAILGDLGIARLGLVVELCSGGGGVTHRLADVADRVIAVEYHLGLVNLMRAVQAGWVPPSDVSRAEYERLREADQTEPLTAFVGFGVSFGGKLWGGYANPGKPRPKVLAGDNPARESSRSLRKASRANVDHVCADATVWELPDGVEVVFIDPPYEGTAGYRDTPAQPAGTWWRRAQALADQGVAVYLTEYAQPPEGVAARLVWSAPAHGKHLTRGTKVERLWRVLPLEAEPMGDFDPVYERECRD
jgi:DNA adenine methylase